MGELFNEVMNCHQAGITLTFKTDKDRFVVLMSRGEEKASLVYRTDGPPLPASSLPPVEESYLAGEIRRGIDLIEAKA